MSGLTLAVVQSFLAELFKHQLAIKMFHFQTEQYGAHKQSDAYLTKFLANMDQFMEVAQGIVGVVQTRELKLRVVTVDDDEIVEELAHFADTLGKMRRAGYPELNAILDIMLADLRQFRYLLSFH